MSFDDRLFLMISSLEAVQWCPLLFVREHRGRTLDTKGTLQRSPAHSQMAPADFRTIPANFQYTPARTSSDGSVLNRWTVHSALKPLSLPVSVFCRIADCSADAAQLPAAIISTLADS